jgi:hypothetical protein
VQCSRTAETVSAGRTNRRPQRVIIAAVPAEVCSTEKSMGTADSRASVCVRTFVRASVALHGQRSDRSSGTRQGLAAVGTPIASLGHADLSCRTYT